MKHIISILLLLATIGCGQKGPAEITGRVSPGEYSEYQLFLIDGDKRDSLSVENQTGLFSLQLDGDTSRIVTLMGVVGTGQNKWPFEQALYIEPGTKVELDIQFKNRRVEMAVDKKDRNNAALITYNRFYLDKSRSIWDNPPVANELKNSMGEIYIRVNDVIEEFRPANMTESYLRIQAYLFFIQALDGVTYMYSRNGEVLPDGMNELIPPVYEVLDDPMALRFYNTNSFVFNYLKKERETPEEQIQLLKERFTVPSIVLSVSRLVLQNFVANYNYKNNFEEGLLRLKNMAAELGEEGEKLVKNFESKKYSMEGAALPDVMLEDVDGQMHKLADFRGKYLYIDLWASWCGPCCQEVPYLQKLEKQLNNPMVEFISISLDTNKKAWKEKMKQLNMHGHQYIVTGDQFATMMNIKGIPHFLLYSKEGTLMQYKAERPSSGDRIRNVLVRLK